MPQRHRVRFGVLAATLALLSCSTSSRDPDAGGPAVGGGGGVPSGGGGGGGGGLGEGGGGSSGEPADAGPYGLLARPPNPTCVAPARPATGSGVALQRAFPNLSFAAPLKLLQAPGEPGRLFVAERAGRVRAFPRREDAGTGEVVTVLDLTSRVDQQGEGGLLGLAFPPDHATSHVLYASFTETGSGGFPLRTVVSRFSSHDGGLTFDPLSEELVLKLDQPFNNHNGGEIAFGPDGYLYLGLGDGGSGGDPLGNGQRLETLLGKVVRLDVSAPGPRRYGIPPTNPFASSGTPCNQDTTANRADAGTRCAELYAWGLRNPWRFSFDLGSGALWAGDVGQSAWEEVDRIQLGGNYGWSVREGAHCYGASTCATGGLIDPVVEYDHSQGSAITGGFVYRGGTIPWLVGRYVYGDSGSARIWAVKEDAVTGATSAELLLQSGLGGLASFGQLEDGELYALELYNGHLSRLVPAGPPVPDAFPATLGATGCFDPADATRLLPALIPYGVNSPLWSDGAAKERAFAIPDGTTIAVGPDGDFDLPIGSVAVKTFSLAGRRVETRLLMRHPDGWAGYSYEWNDAGTDAVLLPAGQAKVVAGQLWTWPSRAQCLGCHTQVAGRTLGLEAAQLDRDFTYPATGLTRNQLTTLEGLGFLDAPLDARTQLRLEPPDGGGALEARARAYLHANCSHCHRQGAGQGPQDLRARQALDGGAAPLSLRQMQVCDVLPTRGDLGVAGARLLAPGAPARSLLSVRMHSTGATRMPPLGTVVEDTAGEALVDAWVSSIAACP